MSTHTHEPNRQPIFSFAEYFEGKGSGKSEEISENGDLRSKKRMRPRQVFHEDIWDLLPEDDSSSEQKPLREKNGKGNAYKHVPHRQRPPQVVAKRNARERRRVQAVNSAFVKLRDAVPIENTRGKRVSKVKTLLYAIEYIRALDDMLQNFSHCQYYKRQVAEDVDSWSLEYWNTSL